MPRWRMVNGKTHSWNACEAEERGEMPISRAVDAVYKAMDCKSRGIPRRVVQEFLEEHCNRGWHHVAGPSGVREVRYYATVLSPELDAELLKLSKK